MRIRFLLACAALMGSAVTARDLPVPPDKGWQHADSGLILPARLDGLPRTRLVDATDVERDVTADFQAPDKSFDATVYIFHPAPDSVPVWFDRIAATIDARDLYGGVSASRPAPVAFAPPGGLVASALRQSYTPTRRTVRGTAVAVMPIGEWLVVVRASSPTLSPAETEARMNRVIAAMRWPRLAPGTEAPAAVPVAACPDALHFAHAKLAKDEGPDLMMAILAGAVTRSTKATPVATSPANWCRDPASGSAYGVYRANADGRGYTMAIGDAGRAANVIASFETQLGKGNSYSVSLTDVDGAVLSFPAFEGMPAPDQVMAVLRKGPTARVTNAANQTNVSIVPPPR